MDERMLNKLFEQLTPETILLTPNARLAAFLQYHYDLYQKQQGHRLWPTLYVHSFQQWLRNTWQDYVDWGQLKPQTILHSSQIAYLWETIIKESLIEHPLLQISTTAKTAAQAWQLMHQQQLNLNHPAFTNNEDSALWQRWAKKMYARYNKNHWTDNSQLGNQLLMIDLAAPKEIFLVGFNDLSQQEQAIINKLSQQGTIFKTWQLTETVEHIAKLPCHDQETELRYMAQWAIHQATLGNSVGCVVTQLHAISSHLKLIFSDYTDAPLGESKPLGQYPLIRHILSTLNLIPLDLKLKKTPAQWATLFQEQFVYELTEEETLLMTRWQKLLEEFSTLNLVTVEMDMQEALHKLKQLAMTTMHQTALQAPIQLLSTTDAAGLTFDCLWIAGWHNDAWPQASAPNPFLPRTNSREQELILSRALTQQLCHAAKNIVVSFPEFDAEQPLNPSTLIEDLPRTSWEALAIPNIATFAENLLHQYKLENIIDDHGPALAQTLSKHRGSNIFKEQAACPFRAFAHLRLGARAPIEPEIGFDALTRGNIAHQVLEQLWCKLKSQENLLSYSENELQNIIHAIVRNVLNQFKSQQSLFLSIEQQRLEKLAFQWLTIEKTREPFVVIATEQTLETNFNNLPLKLRVDRIDQLTDGSHMIIDYKTGSCSTNDWLGDRPNEPQLPLYYVVSTIPVNKIAFAQIRTGDFALKSNKEKLADLKSGWKTVLAKLATEYEQGYAKVKPKDGIQTCQYCDLHTLCRIYETL